MSPLSFILYYYIVYNVLYTEVLSTDLNVWLSGVRSEGMRQAPVNVQNVHSERHKGRGGGGGALGTNTWYSVSCQDSSPGCVLNPLLKPGLSLRSGSQIGMPYLDPVTRTTTMTTTTLTTTTTKTDYSY